MYCSFLVDLQLLCFSTAGNAKERLHRLGNQDLHAAPSPTEYDCLSTKDSGKAVRQTRTASSDRSEIIILNHLQQMLCQAKCKQALQVGHTMLKQRTWIHMPGSE